MPFANFMIANSAQVRWPERCRGTCTTIRVRAGRAIVVASMILYWRRKEQELAAAAERDIPWPLQTERSGAAAAA
jgi:hypothetical protein